jgi:hypothetical protein
MQPSIIAIPGDLRKQIAVRPVEFHLLFEPYRV